VDLEVQAAYLTLQSDKAQLRTLEVSVASADENYNLVREEYRSGLATNLEVYAAQNQLLSARLDLERQKYQVGLDRAALALSQGLLPGEPAGAPPAVTPPEAPPATAPAASAPTAAPLPGAAATPSWDVKR
jgi:outer membrane protein TolC